MFVQAGHGADVVDLAVAPTGLAAVVPESHPMFVQAGHGADVVDLAVLRLFSQFFHPQL